MTGPTLPLALALVAMIVIAVLGARGGWKISRTFLMCLAVGYGAAVISVTLFPIPVQASYIESERVLDSLHNNFVPFVGLGEMLGSQPLDISMRQIAGNVVLFIPFGILLPLLWRGVRGGYVLLAAAITSIAIEGSQFLISSFLGFSYKITDVDDVLLNTLGAAIGYGLVLGERALSRAPARRAARSPETGVRVET
jgi:glycopeptide antibiotics resistance protein